MRAYYAAPESRKALLETLVRTRVLVGEARRRGYDKDPEELRQAEQHLANLVLDRALEGRSKPEDIPEAEAERYYREHAAELVRPGLPRMSQIVVKDRRLAVRLLNRLRSLRANQAEEFGALANKHSIDEASRSRNGDLGRLEQVGFTLPPPVLNAASSLRQPGDLSEIVESKQGFHILRLTEPPSNEPRPFAEMKNIVRHKLSQQWRTKHTEQLVAESRARAKVEVFEERLGAGPAGHVSVASTSSAPTPVPSEKR
jgi:peptidyl-prolyl cis-trans isomerase C